MSDFKEKFATLVDIMARLRSPEGCPWDREQDHQTLKKYLVEETYEVIDAIDHGGDAELAEELGDLILQVVFHAQLATEEERFTIADVLDGINSKLVSRHPHVFGDLKVADSDEVLKNWEQLKTREKAKRKSILEGVPRELPGLLKAYRIQEKVARVGFDWDRVEDVLGKVKEELGEFEEACVKQDEAAIEEELGDLIFSLVNVARYVGKEPEEALQGTIDKFTRRFHYIEEQASKSGQDLSEVPLETMDKFWEEAKKKE